ncbi:MAG: O-antigen ligase family protein [Bacteroidales bacterium]|nr:O-antigen ligase family protein [Bacteroidales bacterium]
MTDTLRKIFCGLIFFSVIYWLMLNYGVAKLSDEIMQISQWNSFCLRGIFPIIIIGVAIFFVEKKHILSTLEWCIVIVGCIEAFYSLMQLYGFSYSNHSIFKLTGSFYNPGPLGGYLAITLPIALNMWLNIKVKKENLNKSENITKFQKINILSQYYILIFTLVLLIIVLPSTMSRTSWISGCFGCIYVLLCSGILKKYLDKIKINKKLLLIIGVIILFLAGIGIWKVKSESANGRLFLWKISTLAVMDSPISGHDIFSPAYGNAQEKYFANIIEKKGYFNIGNEENIATSPDYAFNEYLQFAILYGIPLTLLIIAFLVFAIFFAHKNKRFQFVGGIISLLVFCFASYPMQIPAFVVLLIILTIGLIIPENINYVYHKIILASLLSILAIFMIIKRPIYSERIDLMQKWEKSQMFYNMKVYTKAAKYYAEMSDKMDWNGRFLYEYGHSLYKTEKYQDAIIELNKCLNYLSDPMIFNVIGECYQNLNNYSEAEKYYIRSSHRLPNRLYPHYLLYLLYANENYFKPENRKAEYEIIMNKFIKIESEATREMRSKVENMEKLFKTNN